MEGTTSPQQATATAPNAGAPAVGTRDNPEQITLPGAKARSDARAAAVKRVSKGEVAKRLAGMRQRGPDGKFVARAADEPTDKPDDKPAEEVPQPAEDAPKEAAQAEADKPDEAKKAETPPDVAAKLKAAAEREARYRQGSVEARAKIDDLTDEVEHSKALVDGLRHTVRQVTGRDIDPLELERAELRLQMKRHQRGATQREQRERQQQEAQLRTHLTQKIESTAKRAIADHPEMDPGKSPEARAWWEAWFKAANNRIEDLPDAVAAAALVMRGKQLAALKKQEEAAAPPQPVKTPRPQSSIVAGSPTTTPAPATDVRARLSNKAVHEHMNRLRVMRGGR